MAKYIFPDYTRSIVNMMASIRCHFGLEITHNTLKELDEELNNVRGKERIISTEDSKVKVILIPTDEELVIARDVEHFKNLTN